jgi:hypothetical protein
LAARPVNHLGLARSDPTLAWLGSARPVQLSAHEKNNGETFLVSGPFSFRSGQLFTVEFPGSALFDPARSQFLYVHPCRPYRLRTAFASMKSFVTRSFAASTRFVVGSITSVSHAYVTDMQVTHYFVSMYYLIKFLPHSPARTMQINAFCDLMHCTTSDFHS